MQGRKIILGVTGGISAYKSVELLRLLVKQGASVQVIMTEAAGRFVGPVTFAALSGNPVLIDMFNEDGKIHHIEKAQACDLIVVAPATADFMARAAAGRAEDLLSAVVLATDQPVLLAPAMNAKMWQNPFTQRNLGVLKDSGRFHAVDPGTGDLACGAEGEGRMAEPAQILMAAQNLLQGDFSGLNVLVTAGPTLEPLDPVRFLGNRSSGRMGYALARAASLRGACVTLVSGPVSLDPPGGQVALVRVTTALDMHRAVLSRLKGQDVVIMAAAVADYRPRVVSKGKIKKGEERLSLDLVKNPDILADIARHRKQGARRPVLVGFAVETEHLEARARDKLRRKGCDMVVGNLAPVAFGGDQNDVVMVEGASPAARTGPLSKTAIADAILDKVRGLLSRNPGGRRRK